MIRMARVVEGEAAAIECDRRGIRNAIRAIIGRIQRHLVALFGDGVNDVETGESVAGRRAAMTSHGDAGQSRSVELSIGARDAQVTTDVVDRTDDAACGGDVEHRAVDGVVPSAFESQATARDRHRVAPVHRGQVFEALDEHSGAANRIRNVKAHHTTVQHGQSTAKVGECACIKELRSGIGRVGDGRKHELGGIGHTFYHATGGDARAGDRHARCEACGAADGHHIAAFHRGGSRDQAGADVVHRAQRHILCGVVAHRVLRPAEDARDHRALWHARAGDRCPDDEARSRSHRDQIASTQEAGLLVRRAEIDCAAAAITQERSAASDDLVEVQGVPRDGAQPKGAAVRDEASEVGGIVQSQAGTGADGGAAGVVDVAQREDLVAIAGDSDVQQARAVVVGPVAQETVEALRATGLQGQRAGSGNGLALRVLNHATRAGVRDASHGFIKAHEINVGVIAVVAGAGDAVARIKADHGGVGDLLTATEVHHGVSVAATADIADHEVTRDCAIGHIRAIKGETAIADTRRRQRDDVTRRAEDRADDGTGRNIRPGHRHADIESSRGAGGHVAAHITVSGQHIRGGRHCRGRDGELSGTIDARDDGTRRNGRVSEDRHANVEVVRVTGGEVHRVAAERGGGVQALDRAVEGRRGRSSAAGGHGNAKLGGADDAGHRRTGRDARIARDGHADKEFRRCATGECDAEAARSGGSSELERIGRQSGADTCSGGRGIGRDRELGAIHDGCDDGTIGDASTTDRTAHIEAGGGAGGQIHRRAASTRVHAEDFRADGAGEGAEARRDA